MTSSRTARSTSACPIRRTAWTGRPRRRRSKAEALRSGPIGRFGPGLPVSRRRADAVPAPPRPQDAARARGRRPRRHRPQRLAAVQRRRRVRASRRSAAGCWRSDLVEAIVALPTNMFFNTGIATYIWILDNTKRPERQGKVQLIDATSFWTKMRKNLGAKNREVGAAARERS